MAGLGPERNLVSSTNGVHWQTTRTLAADEDMLDLEHANGLWVLLLSLQSTNLLLFTSGDGATWSAANLPALPPPDLGWGRITLRYGGGEWLLRARKHLVLRSTDGRNWTSDELGAPPEGEIRDLAYGEGKWVAQVHATRVTFHPLACSTNLLRWEWWQPWPFDGYTYFTDLRYFNGFWFGMADQIYVEMSKPPAAILTSRDGSSWTTRFLQPELGGVTLDRNRLVVRSRSLVNGQWINQTFGSDALLLLETRQPRQFTVLRAEGMPVAAEWMDDFQPWQTLTNLTAGHPIVYVSDGVTNTTRRFYRARTP